MTYPTEEKKVFVYGSLREGFFNYDKYLKNKVPPASLGEIKGKLFHLSHKGYPALLDGDDTVIGEIMALKDFYEDIVSLDQMEGFRSFEDISINEYIRTTINVKNLETKAIENCYVYKYVDGNDKNFNSHAIYIHHGDWKKYMNIL
ncbi:MULTISPECIES: gamma-glutamylcyclotransferase [unclassified Clostridium]|uniref:gamma-glutamylcyclotransferase n=1 Tax=unclassified Clostridium TaxID=2614128 RepID=UPI001243300C